MRARAQQYSRLRSAGHTKCNCALRAQINTDLLVHCLNFTHAGHFKSSPNEVNRGIRDVPAESLDLISQLFEKHCPVSIAQQFLELTNGSKKIT